MDFAGRIRDLASRVPRQLDHVVSEEATKNALVMPFLSALGYDVFDPAEVTPELHADIKSYCGVLLDDNNRKPICCLHFNSAQKYLGLFDVETRIASPWSGCGTSTASAAVCVSP